MGKKADTSFRLIPLSESARVCNAVSQRNTIRDRLLKMFPSLKCQDRSTTVFAREFLTENRQLLRNIAAKYDINVLLLAGILYNEMTWSRLGARGANLASYMKVKITNNKETSVGYGAVQVKHVMKWYGMDVDEAAYKLYSDAEFSIDSSAKIISEIYHKLKKNEPNQVIMLPSLEKPVSPYRYLHAVTEELKLWIDVASEYNGGNNPDYARAFEYSINEIADIFAL